jgi:hypothetical protein
MSSLLTALLLLFLPFTYLQAAQQPNAELQKARQEQTFKALCKFYANFPEGKICANFDESVSVGGNSDHAAYDLLCLGKTFQETITFLNSCTVRNLEWEREVDWRQEPDKERDEQEIKALATWLKSQTSLTCLSIGTQQTKQFPDFIPLMTEAVASHPNLTSLNVWTLDVKDALVSNICKTLKDNTILTSLRIGRSATNTDTMHLELESAQTLIDFVKQHPQLTKCVLGHDEDKVFPSAFDKAYRGVTDEVSQNIRNYQTDYYATQCAGAVFWAAAQGKTCKKERREGKMAPLWEALANGSLTSDYLEHIVSFLVGDHEDASTVHLIKINPQAYEKNQRKALKKLYEKKAELSNKTNRDYIALLEACGAWNQREQELAAPQLRRNFEILTQATYCSKLSFYQFNLDKNSLQFMPLLNQCSFITELDISNAKVDPVFFDYLKTNKTIKSLVTHNFHEKNDVVSLAHAIASNKTLTHLELHGGPIDTDLLEAVGTHPALTHLEWNSYDKLLTSNQIKLLIGSKSKLKSLVLHCKLYSINELEHIARAIQDNYTLTHFKHTTEIDRREVWSYSSLSELASEKHFLANIEKIIKRNHLIEFAQKLESKEQPLYDQACVLASKIQPLYRGYLARKQYTEIKAEYAQRLAEAKCFEGLTDLFEVPASFYKPLVISPALPNLPENEPIPGSQKLTNDTLQQNSRADAKQLEGLEALFREPETFYQPCPPPPEGKTDGADDILEKHSQDASSGKLIATGTGIVISLLAVSASALIAKMKIKSKQQSKECSGDHFEKLTTV